MISRTTFKMILAVLLISAKSIYGQSSLNLVVPVGHSDAIVKMVVSNDNKLLASVGKDNLVLVWEIEAGKILKRFVLDSTVNTRLGTVSIYFSPDSQLLGLTIEKSYGADSRLHKLFDLNSGQELISHEGELISFNKHEIYYSEFSYQTGYRLFRRSLDKNAKPQQVLGTLALDPLWSKRGSETFCFLTDEAKQVYMLATSSGKITPLLKMSWGDREPPVFRLQGNLGFIAEAGGFVHVYDLTTGVLARLPGEYIYLENFRFSSDGKVVVATCMDGTRAWELATRKPIANVTPFVSDDEKPSALSVYDEFEVEETRGKIVARNKASKKELSFTFNTHVHFDDFRKVAYSTASQIAIADVQHAEELSKFNTGEQHSVTDLKFSVDNTKLFCADGKLTMIGLKDSRIVNSPALANYLAIPEKGDVILTADDSHIRLVDHKLNVVTDSINAVVHGNLQASPDLSLITWASAGSTIIHVVRKNDQLGTYSLPREEATVVKTEGYLLLANGKAEMMHSNGRYVHDLLANNGQVFDADGDRYYQTPSSDIGSGIARNGKLAYNGYFFYKLDSGKMKWTKSVVSVSPVMTFANSELLVAAQSTGSNDIAVLHYKNDSLRLKYMLRGHTSSLLSITFSADDKLLASSSRDNTVKLWELETGKELCTIRLLSNADWVVVSPDGQFDASDGAMRMLYFVYGIETINLSQLKDRFYEPGLLNRLVTSGPSPAGKKQDFGKLDLYPDVSAILDEKNAVLKLTVTNRDGGIGKIPVFVNGREILEDARVLLNKPVEQIESQKIFTVDVDLSSNRHIVWGQANYVGVRAYNKAGYLVSKGKLILYAAPSRSELITNFKPSLYAIVSGVSSYANHDLDLKFSSKDAEDISKALKLAGGNLFGDRVFITELTSRQSDPALRPTKTNLIKAFQQVAEKASPADVLVVYLSGHGVNTGGAQGDFIYLTEDASSFNFSDPAIRKASSLSSSEITEFLKTITAKKQVMVIDACASGQVVDNLIARKSIPSSTLVALDRLKDRVGTYIITGCAADAVSYEASHFGQGLLTYSVLSAMRGAALRESRYVDVLKLFQYSRDEVPRLAQHIGGIQEPKIFSPYGGDSFDIGILETMDDKEQIPLAVAKPFFLRSSFQNEASFKDNLGLTRLFDEHLSALSAKGKESPLIFIDVNEFPDAYSLIGRYTVKGDDINVTLRLFRNEQEMKLMTASGNKQDLSALTEKLLLEINQFVEK